VPGDRTRGVPDLVTAESGAEAEVDVLVVGEEALVESAELAQDGRTPHRRGAGGAEHFDLVAEAAVVRLAMTADVGEERPCQPVAGAVEAARLVREQELGRRRGRRRVPSQTGGKLLEPSWFGDGVVVQKGNEAGPRLRDPRVHRGGEAAVLRERDQADLGKSLADELDGAVTRAVVDDDHLVGCKRLARERRQARIQEVSAVQVRNDNGYGH
jgi:hypothetical protein